MATAAQTLANQQNARHSTGPTTRSGKRRSSLNAVRHGLTSQLVVLPGEDHAPYQALRDRLFADLAPEGAVEEMLAQSVCDTHWRIERARKAEANILALAHYEDLPPAINAIEDPAQRTAIIEAYAATKYERALRNLQIQEARLARTLFQYMTALANTQLDRRTAAHAKLTEAINARTAHQAQAREFQPAALGFVFTTEEIDQEIDRRYMQYRPTSPQGPRKPKTREEWNAFAAVDPGFQAIRDVLNAPFPAK